LIVTLTRPQIAAFATLAASLCLSSCSQRVVATDLDSSEAQRCAIVLRAEGLDVAIDRDDAAGDGRARVTVRGDEADYRTALAVLEAHSLPRRLVAGFSTETQSLIPSPSEERARYIKGLSGEIERMLESIDGVISAEVLVSVPERRPLSPSVEEASASAVVAHSGESSPVTADEVRAIVVRAAGSSLTPERVTVVLKPVARSGTAKPIVRYERDRVTEVGFLAAVMALAAAEGVTVWMLRSRRRATLEVEHDA
jgi:type III secretion protein J